MKYKIIKKILVSFLCTFPGTVNRFLCIVILTSACFTALSQPLKILKPSVYENFIKQNRLVKVQTIEEGKVKQTNTAELNNIQMPVGKKTIIPYENKIAAIDMASFQKFKTLSSLPDSAKDVKVIPELHVEPGNGQTEDIAYRIMFTLQQPFLYNASTGNFSARLGFLLLNESGNSDASIDPVKIEVVSGDVKSIHPGSLEINHLSIPSTNVDIIAENIKDSTPIKVITTSNPEGYTAYLKVKPALEISTNSASLQGLGIEQILVNVKFIGSNSPDSEKVIFSSGKGTVIPNSVYVSYNKPTTVSLRSDGMGSSKISATSNTGQSNELSLTFVFPWLFLLASILGGLIGSLAKYFLNVPDKKSSVKPVIGGILIGFIGAIAYYGLGVNLLGINLSAGLNALAVLALSALCAYFGISLMKLDGKQ